MTSLCFMVQSPLIKRNLQLIINIGLLYETLKQQKSEAWIWFEIIKLCQNFGFSKFEEQLIH